MKFKPSDVISINRETFTIDYVKDEGTIYECLVGTKQNDPSFLKGKRTVVVSGLKQKSEGKYDYDWNSK